MFKCHVRLAKGTSVCKPTYALAVESLESHHSLLVNDRTVAHLRGPCWAWKITVRHVVPNNNRRYGKQPACNTEEQRFFGHNLDGTGYLGWRLIAKFSGCLIFPKLRLDSTVLDLNRLGWRTIRVKSSKKSWRRLGTLKLGDCWNDGLNFAM